MRNHCINGIPAVLLKDIHLCSLITFRNKSYINFIFAITGFPKVFPCKITFVRNRSYQYVLRIYTMRHLAFYLIVCICQGNRYINRFLGKRDKEDIFKGFLYARSLLRGLPLLEKRTERMPVKHYPTLAILHTDLSVSKQKQAVQIHASAIPVIRNPHLIKINMLTMIIA